MRRRVLKEGLNGLLSHFQTLRMSRRNEGKRRQSSPPHDRRRSPQRPRASLAPQSATGTSTSGLQRQNAITENSPRAMQSLYTRTSQPQPSGSGTSHTVSRATLPETAKKELDYAKIAMRGASDMTNAKNPPELPNPQGVTASGRFEATKPTAAPIARWQLAKIQGELRHVEFFRVGV